MDEPVCNCSNRVSIEYLSEGRYRLGDKTIFIRVSVPLTQVVVGLFVLAEPLWRRSLSGTLSSLPNSDYIMITRPFRAP